MSGLSTANFKRNLEPEQVEPVEVVEDAVDKTTDTDAPVSTAVVTEGAPQEVINTGENLDNKSNEPVDKTTDSSLKTEKPESEVISPIEVNEASVKKFLSEKLGREVSLEDFTKEPSTNPLDSDPYMKEIYEWRAKTGRPIEDYIKFQKDFKDVADLEIAREFLQLEYPDSTSDEINIELRRFTSSEDDLEEEVAQKNWELKKYATKGRTELDKLKSSLGEPNTSSLPTEIQDKVSFADKIKSQMADNGKMQEDYDTAIKTAALSVERMSLNLDGESSIDFLVSEESRKSIPDTISQMSHWRNEDGSWNHRAVVEDGIKITNFDAMIKLAYEQGQNSGKDGIIRETKNVNLSDTGSSAQPTRSLDRPVYEDEDKGAKQGLKIRSRKK
jgi:hypothetical protein